MSDRYNGWANYETWCVHLWLANDYGSQTYWLGEANSQLKHSKQVYRDHQFWTPEESARADLADQMKEEIENMVPEMEASMFTDLMSSALDRVDWREIAESFLEDIDDDDDDDDDYDEQTDEPQEFVST